MSTVGGAVTASSFLIDSPRFEVQALRYAATTAVLVAISAVARRPNLRARRARAGEWIWLFLAATSGQTIYNLALVGAVQHADPAFVASVVSCVPLVLVLGAPLFGRRRFRPDIAAAAVVVVAGAAIVYGGGETSPLGLCLSLVALAGEAAFTLFSLRVLDRLGPFSVAVHTCWIACLQLVVIGWVLGELRASVPWPSSSALAVAYLVAASAFAFVAWFRAVESVGAEVAGLATGIIPVAAAVSGAALGIVPLRAQTLVGAAVVGVGVTGGAVLARRSPSQPGLVGSS